MYTPPHLRTNTDIHIHTAIQQVLYVLCNYAELVTVFMHVATCVHMAIFLLLYAWIYMHACIHVATVELDTFMANYRRLNNQSINHYQGIDILIFQVIQFSYMI